MISILMPYLSTPMNDEAIKIVKETLADNTVGEYELLFDDDPNKEVYAKCNELVDKANSDWISFWNSDVFPAPGWDVLMRKYRSKDAIVLPYLVECGAIGVASVNVPADFGWRPESYDREGFEKFAAEHGAGVPEVRDFRAWYFPCLLHRDRFKELGGFDTTNGAWPHQPLDIWLWNKHEETGGRFLQTRSYAYHLQCLSWTDRVNREGR